MTTFVAAPNRTSVKTANYSASPDDLVPVDATNANVTITLPNSPVNATRVTIKVVAVGAGKTVTAQCSGTDVFNKAGGSTAVSLSLVNQAVTLQYDKPSGIWTVVSDDLPKAALDLIYEAIIKKQTAAQRAADLTVSGAGVLTTTTDTGDLAVGDGVATTAALKRLVRLDEVTSAVQAYVSSLVVTNSSLQQLAIDSGYVWALVDSTNHISWYIKADGTVGATKWDVASLQSSLGSKLPQDLNLVVGPLWALTDNAGRIALAVQPDGSVTGKFVLNNNTIVYAMLDPTLQAKIATDLTLAIGPLWAITDNAGRVAIGVQPDGSVNIPKITLGNASITKVMLGPDVPVPAITTVDVGFAWSVTDQNNEVALGVRTDGTVFANGIATSATGDANATYVVGTRQVGSVVQVISYAKSSGNAVVLAADGVNLNPRLTSDGYVVFSRMAPGAAGPVAYFAPPDGSAPAQPLVSLDTVTCWGDSLTALGAWEQSLSQKLNYRTVVVEGVGGETSVSIAGRQNGAPSLLTVTGNQIPASGAVAVTAHSVQYYAMGAGGPVTVKGTLAGVHGTITTDASQNITFTRDTAGSVVACPPNTPFYTDNGVAARSNTNIFWMGRNNYSQQSTVLANLQAAVAYDLPYLKRFLVLEIPPWVGEEFGTGARTTLDATNAAIQAQFPNNWVPIATWVRTNGLADLAMTPTSQDTTDMANGLTPTSLRSDAGHYNTAGCSAIADRLYQEFVTRGWA